MTRYFCTLVLSLLLFLFLLWKVYKQPTNSTNNQIPHIRIEEVEKFDQEIDDFEIKNIEDDQNFGIDDEPRSEISTDNEIQISLIDVVTC